MALGLHLCVCSRVERCAYLRQAIVFTRARVNLPWIYAMHLIIARMRTYVLSTQLGVLRDQLRILSVRKCADFHENRLIYAYLSTRVYIDKVASPWQATRNSYTRSFSAIPASLPLILEEQIVSTAHYFSDRILFSKGMCTLIPEPISDIPLYHWAQAIFCEFPNV